MKNLINVRLLLTGTIFLLMVANVFLFASSVQLTDNITKLEFMSQDVKKNNTLLYQKLYSENSIATLEFVADDMGFTQEAEPYYLDRVGYAMAN